MKRNESNYSITNCFFSNITNSEAFLHSYNVYKQGNKHYIFTWWKCFFEKRIFSCSVNLIPIQVNVSENFKRLESSHAVVAPLALRGRISSYLLSFYREIRTVSGQNFLLRSYSDYERVKTTYNYDEERSLLTFYFYVTMRETFIILKHIS